MWAGEKASRRLSRGREEQPAAGGGSQAASYLVATILGEQDRHIHARVRKLGLDVLIAAGDVGVDPGAPVIDIEAEDVHNVTDVGRW